MKVGGGGNWPIKLRLEGYQRSAIILAARQNRQLGFDEDHKGANLPWTFCLCARNATVRHLCAWRGRYCTLRLQLYSTFVLTLRLQGSPPDHSLDLIGYIIHHSLDLIGYITNHSLHLIGYITYHFARSHTPVAYHSLDLIRVHHPPLARSHRVHHQPLSLDLIGYLAKHSLLDLVGTSPTTRFHRVHHQPLARSHKRVAYHYR